MRTALWRALHLRIDQPPHVLEDEIGLQLAAPDDGWMNRPDMSEFTRPFRASILACACFVEDLVVEQAALGGNTLFLGRGWIRFPSIGRNLPPGCGCSRLTSPDRRNGSAGGA